MTKNSKRNDLDVDLMDTLGRRFDVKLNDVPDHLLHRSTLLYYVLCALILLATDAPGVLDSYPLSVAVLFWVVGFATYIALYPPALLTVALLQSRFVRIPMPMPLLCVLTLVPSVGLAQTVGDALTGSESHVFAPTRFLTLLLTVHPMETIYSRFVLPKVKEQTTSAKARALLQKPRCVSVGTQRLEVCRILHVAAQEHFIRIQLEDSHILHRARLSDLVAQTEPQDGIQPHRSWWVSRSAKPRLDRDGQRHVLILEDETVVPVARSRLRAIEKWLKDDDANQHMAAAE